MRLIDADALWMEIIHRMDYCDDILEIIESMPTIEPERTGKWIREPNCWYRCSECGNHYPSIRDCMDYGFCPNCGCRMTEEKA